VMSIASSNTGLFVGRFGLPGIMFCRFRGLTCLSISNGIFQLQSILVLTGGPSHGNTERQLHFDINFLIVTRTS
jgi:hypothetical protein